MRPETLLRLNQFIQQMIDDGKIDIKAHKPAIHVYHDEWCKNNTGGMCNCEPEFSLECRDLNISHMEFVKTPLRQDIRSN